MARVRYSSFNELPGDACVASIGTFDGVHRGHQYLLRQLTQRARMYGVPSMVVTFEPTPSQVFNPSSPLGRLTTDDQRTRHILACGIDRILVLPFTTELARLAPEEFMAQLAIGSHPRELWVGADFALGHRRAGDVQMLTAIGRDLGIDVRAIERVDFDGMAVGSSKIRELIAAGDVAEAGRLLGYRYAVTGEVIRGAQIGRTIGYPTANVALPDRLVMPADGIYATNARVADETQEHAAMTYIGTRPALNTGPRLIETHLLDFDGDLYGQELITTFVQYLRPDANFDGVHALVKQLQRDELGARAALGKMTEISAARAGDMPDV